MPTNYTTAMVRDARKWAAAGFTTSEVQRMLEREHGQRPSHHTVRHWIDEQARERKNERMREWHRNARMLTAKFRMPSQTEQYQRAFILKLREERVPFSSIAKVCNVVFDGAWNEDSVRRFVIREEQAA